MNDEARLDHRAINYDVLVFATDPLAGAGLPLWLPDGAVIRDELQRLAKDLARADGCQSVYSPALGKRALFERSGHWSKFSDDMFPPMPVGGDELVLRPANCPHHALIYASRQRSYRDLPVRLNELAAMFRAERSGVLSGLSRAPSRSSGSRWTTCGCPGATTAPPSSAAASSGKRRRRRCARRPRTSASPLAASGWSMPTVRRRSTAPSSTCSCETAAATRRPSRPCNSTSTSPSGST